MEYRTAGTERRTGHEWLGEPRDERPAPRYLAQLRIRNDNVRVQKRTVIESPWKDCDEGGEG